MKFAIISRGDPLSNGIKDRLHHYLSAYHWKENEEYPSLGDQRGRGDGTMLEAFHRYKHLLDQVAFVGVHTGRLGFYADWRPDELETLVQSIAANRFTPVMFLSLVEVLVAETNGTVNLSWPSMSVR